MAERWVDITDLYDTPAYLVPEPVYQCQPGYAPPTPPGVMVDGAGSGMHWTGSRSGLPQKAGVFYRRPARWSAVGGTSALQLTGGLWVLSGSGNFDIIDIAGDTTWPPSTGGADGGTGDTTYAASVLPGLAPRAGAALAEFDRLRITYREPAGIAIEGASIQFSGFADTINEVDICDSPLPAMNGAADVLGLPGTDLTVEMTASSPLTAPPCISVRAAKTQFNDFSADPRVANVLVWAPIRRIEVWATVPDCFWTQFVGCSESGC